jgi:two-component system chemotaxis response regulator CheB
MPQISVLVVDDSVVVRRLVSDVLESDPDIRVVGTAANGRIALAKLAQLNPDVVTLDVEMPVMDGLEALRELRRTHPRLPVIMFSTLTERGAAATLDALELGADDYVTKPANVGSVQASMASVREQLIPRIRSLAGRGSRSKAAVSALARPTPATTPPAPPALRRPRVPVRPPSRPRVLAIGVSTGGPDALATVLSALPADFEVPVVVVQHMPPVFTRLLAERLDTKCALAVREAADGDLVVPGRVLVAPGDRHLRLQRSGQDVVARLDEGPPENYCRPAVDVLFRSVTDVYGAGALGLVLTGMGTDGARGAERIVEAGGQVLAQDRATSVVWGMPGAVAGAGLAAEVLPLAQITPAVRRRVSGQLTGSAR